MTPADGSGQAGAQAGTGRARLREPGLIGFQPGTERYRVAGGGCLVVALRAGDRISVTDIEGRQPCELVAFDAQGRVDVGVLGAQAGIEPSGSRAILDNAGEGADALRAALERWGLGLDGARALAPFGAEGPAGAAAAFEAEAEALCLIAAPGGPMRAEAQDPPTDLRVVIRRARVDPDAPPPLPEPLAEPRLDLRIDRATARAYEVREGEYIQIIDVAGRQCSDFQCFDAAQLQRGLERELDVTTTRTLMGAAYPGPGLHSKYYDRDMQPLVEVVRDLCGRHDTFGLACTAKYYEDRGYPGHANCSDNFSRALEPYGVAARRGWPAANLFFNTGFDETNALTLEEPWSRPGDYVLLRSFKDLVCASSACPDDIDAANAWNPTDIHLRVYPAENLFSKSVATRATADAEPQMTRETAFHSRTSKLTRKFAEYRGFWLPTGFTGSGTIEAYSACRERAVVLDLSALRKFEVLGPDAEALMQRTLTRDVRRLSIGQVSYSAMCYETGGMIDDGTLFRLGADNFRWICGDDYCGVWLREQAEKLGLRVWVKSSTEQLHNLAVQGPKSREILKEIVWSAPDQPDLEELGWFRFAVGRIGDFDGIPVVVSRTGYTGELGYEVWCHPKDGAGVWDAIWQAGAPHGLAPLGLDALDILRIEAGLIFGGAEFCDRTDPFEAGIGFTVALDDDEDFIGKAALAKRKESPQRRLVGLELAGNEPAAHGDGVYLGRAQVGAVTSATRSPLLRKNIALCRLDVSCAGLGTEVEVGKIDGHQKRIPATVVRVPFYDPDKRRVRS
jgi:aminomethyltransferase